jgi:hypothetical protein
LLLPLHLLSRGVVGVPMPQEEVTWAQEAAIAGEATHVKAVHAVKDSAREVAVARESATAVVRDVEN